jgi:O-antigen/teichoic acid export membrane protein
MLKNGLVNGIGAAIKLLLGVVTIPALIAYMGVDGYGSWAFLTAVIGVFGVAEAGLPTTVTLFLARDISQQDREGAGTTVTMSFIAIFFLASLGLLLLYLGSEKISRILVGLSQQQYQTLTTALRIGAIIFFSRTLQQFAIGVIQAYEKYQLLNLIVTLQVAISNAVLIAIAANRSGIVVMATWLAIAGSISAIILFAISFRNLSHSNIGLAWNPSRVTQILRFSATSFFTALGGLLFSQADRLVVGYVLGPSHLGFYSAVTGVAVQINTVSSMPVQPLLPRVSSLYAQLSENAAAIRDILATALRLNTVVALSMSLVLFVFAGEIARFLSIPDLAESVLSIRIAAVVYGALSINAVGYWLLLGTRGNVECMWIHLASGLLALSSIYIGAKAAGATGAIVGNFGYCLVWLLTVVGMRRVGIGSDVWLRWVVPMIGLFVLAVTPVLFLPDNRAAQIITTLVFGCVGLYSLIPRRQLSLNGICVRR